MSIFVNQISTRIFFGFVPFYAELALYRKWHIRTSSPSQRSQSYIRRSSILKSHLKRSHRFALNINSERKKTNKDTDTMVAFSIPTVIFFLVALGSSQAQNGQECCSSSYSALAFDGLRGIPATHYYDASTGNRLTVSEAAGMSRFFESATGTMYIRQGGTCTSRQNPAAVVSVFI